MKKSTVFMLLFGPVVAFIAGLLIVAAYENGMLEKVKPHFPAPYHRGQSINAWQRNVDVNAAACNALVPAEQLQDCLVFTGAAI